MPEGYGVRYRVVGRDDRPKTVEKFFKTEQARTKACEQLEGNSNFIEFIAWHEPEAEDAAK